MKKNILKKTTLLILSCWMVFNANAQIGQKIKTETGSSLAGTWICNNAGQTLTLVLYGNNKGEFEGDEISYTQTENKLTIKSATGSTTYGYKLNGSNLSLSGGDLSKPVTFSKNGAQAETVQTTPRTATNNSAAGKDLLGTWEAQGMQFTFKEGGIMLYNDKTMEYTVKGKTLYCQNDQAGVSVTYDYEISKNYLMLKNNGNTIMLQKKNGSQDAGRSNNSIAGGNRPPFLGNWISTENEHLSLMDGGRMKLENYDLTYTYDAGTLTVNAPNGAVTFSYKLSGNILSVTAPGGKISTYQKEGTANTNGYNNNQQSTQGGIDQTMVGKWCIAKTSSGGYNTTGSSSSSECFVLEANGTYQYSSEGRPQR